MKLLTLAAIAMLAYFLGRNRSRETLRYLLRGTGLMILLLFAYFVIYQYHHAIFLFLGRFTDWLQRLPQR